MFAYVKCVNHTLPWDTKYNYLLRAQEKKFEPTNSFILIRIPAHLAMI